MNEEFLKAMSAAYPPQATTAPVAAISIWGYSIIAIIKLAAEKARELGKPYRAQIEAAGKQAIDRLVALDLPWIPENLEGVIDATTKALGYTAVEAILNAAFAEQTKLQEQVKDKGKTV